MGIPVYEDRVHSPMGFAVLCIIWVIVLGGVITRSRLDRTTGEMSRIHGVKQVHKFLGYFIIAAANITNSFGIYAYCRNRSFSTNLDWMSLMFFFCLWAILEIRH